MRSKSPAFAEPRSPAAAPPHRAKGPPLLQPDPQISRSDPAPAPPFGHDFGRVRVHAGSGPVSAAPLAPVPVLGSTGGPVLQRAPLGNAREVVGTKPAASNILLIPEGPPPSIRVEQLAHVRGGLETDNSLRPRVSVVLGPGATALGIAAQIRPFFVAAGTASAPSVDELARAILVYNQEYIPVPAMTRFRVGLRLPLPIEIDPATGAWIVHPGQVQGWAGSFDPTLQPLLSRAPEDLKVATAADQEAAVDAFLAARTTPLARGIALGARLLTNAFDTDQFALRLFDKLGDAAAFDVALEMMNFTAPHQAAVFASQGAAIGVLWRVMTLLSLPPAKLSPEREKERLRALGQLPAGTVLGMTAKKQPVQAFLFPGASSERALVLAGVHGSEQSGVEVVELLLAELRKGVRPHFTTLVVPKLFPDNYDKALREGPTETNRNFPVKGTSLDTARAAGGAKGPIDALGKRILPENILLLQVIERFRPSRIASVHATWDLKKPGVFTDPHKVSKGALAANAGGGSAKALEDAARAASDSDRDFALKMAREAQKNGANVAGNKLGSGDENVGFYQKDPPGSSLGGYGPQDVTEGKATDRPAMQVITMEVGGNPRSSAEKDPRKLAARQTELRALRDVLLFLFLRVPRP
jgi:hypothetical protein